MTTDPTVTANTATAAIKRRRRGSNRSREADQ